MIYARVLLAAKKRKDGKSKNQLTKGKSLVLLLLLLQFL